MKSMPNTCISIKADNLVGARRLLAFKFTASSPFRFNSVPEWKSVLWAGEIDCTPLRRDDLGIIVMEVEALD